MSKPLRMETKRTREADRIMRLVIEERGLSYADAIRWCEREAYKASRPYLQVAAELKAALTATDSTGGTDG